MRISKDPRNDSLASVFIAREEIFCDNTNMMCHRVCTCYVENKLNRYRKERRVENRVRRIMPVVERDSENNEEDDEQVQEMQG